MEKSTFTVGNYTTTSHIRDLDVYSDTACTSPRRACLC